MIEPCVGVINNSSIAFGAIMAEGVRRGHLAMGRVSIWGQWLIIISGLLLSPLFLLFMAGVIGRSQFPKLWRHRTSALAEM